MCVSGFWINKNMFWHCRWIKSIFVPDRLELEVVPPTVFSCCTFDVLLRPRDMLSCSRPLLSGGGRGRS